MVKDSESKAQRNKDWRLKNADALDIKRRAYYAANKARIVAYNIELRRKRALDPSWRQRRIFLEARRRAIKNDIPFNIEPTDIKWPFVCPVLGIPLVYNNNRKGYADCLPSLDRIVPSKGYVVGNVFVISSRANRIKYNATVDELRRVADYLEAMT